jgi:Na+-translocating ferredoxin:NAD+ oxidoreductase subunit B
MENDDKVYRKLQRHLNKQAIGYPATRSGVELNILRHIFDPKEAEIATHLSYKLESIDTILEQVKDLVDSADELETNLSSICKKGGVAYKIKNGVKYYCCLPLVVDSSVISQSEN